MQYEQSMEKDAKKLKLLLQREAQALIELYPIVGGYYTDKTMISLSLLEVVKFGKYSPYSKWKFCVRILMAVNIFHLISSP